MENVPHQVFCFYNEWLWSYIGRRRGCRKVEMTVRVRSAWVKFRNEEAFERDILQVVSMDKEDFVVSFLSFFLQRLWS